MNLALVPKKEFTQCVICDAPLGSDTRDSYVMFCKNHTVCIHCTKPVSLPELKMCLKRYYEDLEDEQDIDYSKVLLYHSDCDLHSQRHNMDRDPTLSIKQSEYDFLNNLRFMVMPDLSLNDVTNTNTARICNSRIIANMDIESMRMHLKKIEECATQIRIAIKKDPSYRKELLLEAKPTSTKSSKDSTNLTSIATAASTSAKTLTPAKQREQQNEEVQLTAFMELHELTDKKEALKLMKEMNKNISHMTKSGMKEPEARSMILSFMIQNGQLKK